MVATRTAATTPTIAVVIITAIGVVIGTTGVGIIPLAVHHTAGITIIIIAVIRTAVEAAIINVMMTAKKETKRRVETLMNKVSAIKSKIFLV